MRHSSAPLRQLVLVALLALLPAARLGAQEERVPPHAIAGEVVHDETGVPLPDATVLLATATPGVLPTAESTFVPAARTMRTDAAGRYRFDGVPAGRYVLRVHRMGYRPATLEVELRGGESRVSVGLTVVPIRLAPVEVTVPPVDSASRDVAGMHALPGADALRDRQRRFLGTDVRELTREEMAHAVTLGDMDLFRALQRLPGVGGPSDWSAELQTRGARWDQTRVLFDGLPLFNPMHFGSLISGVSADAVGAAFLHPGVRPAAIGEGSAAVLDLHSRPAGGDGERRGVAELSLINARASLEQRVAGGRGAWMLSARRSHADLLLPLFLSGQPAQRYYFSDLVGRFDWRFAGGSTLEVSALRSRDVEQGSMYDAAYPPYDTAAAYREEASRWGNLAARVTLATPLRAGWLGGVLARHTVGASGNGSRWGGVTATSNAREPFDSHVGYTTVTGEYAPLAEGGRAPGWNAGWALVRQRARAEGWLRSRFTVDFFQPDTVSRVDGATTQLALWGERRIRPTPSLEIAPGLRVETGDAIRGAGRLRVAPRLATRLALADSATFLSASVGRSWQHAQSIPGYQRSRASREQAIPLWLVADGDTPALMTDLATLGAERWLGARWHASANAWARRTRGLLLPDPRPGPFTDKALFVEGRELARGFDAALRRLEGRWTMAAGYSYTAARASALGLTFASPAERRHVLDLTSSVRLGKGFRVGGAFTAATGAPYTHIIPGTLTTGSGGRSEWVTLPATGTPYGERYPSFASLDVMLEWSGTMRGLPVTAWLQANNVLMRRNAAFFQPRYGCHGDQATSSCDNPGYFQYGLIPLPVIGIRLTF